MERTWACNGGLYSCQKKWMIILETPGKSTCRLTLTLTFFNRNETKIQGRFLARLFQLAGINSHSKFAKCCWNCGRMNVTTPVLCQWRAETSVLHVAVWNRLLRQGWKIKKKSRVHLVGLDPMGLVKYNVREKLISLQPPFDSSKAQVRSLDRIKARHQRPPVS